MVLKVSSNSSVPCSKRDKNHEALVYTEFLGILKYLRKQHGSFP